MVTNVFGWVDIDSFDVSPSLIVDKAVAPESIKSKVLNRLRSSRSGQTEDLLGRETATGGTSFEGHFEGQVRPQAQSGPG